MQFAILLFINIILWTLFYFVISLKLERSASEFREKKMRREMDQIIQDFNATAERNISILENRISIMKRLLRQTGAYKEFSVDVRDETVTPAGPDAGGAPADNADAANDTPTVARAGDAPPAAAAPHRGPDRSGDVHSGGVVAAMGGLLSALIGPAIAAVGEFKKRSAARSRAVAHADMAGKRGFPAAFNAAMQGGAPGVPDVPDEAAQPSLQKELSDVRTIMQSAAGKLESSALDEAGIADMFAFAEDKYSLISELFTRGCSVEILAKCSGIPVGEIKLVLNLNRPH